MVGHPVELVVYLAIGQDMVNIGLVAREAGQDRPMAGLVELAVG